MLLAKDFRAQAYDALNGRWALAIGTAFVAGLLGGSGGGLNLSTWRRHYSDFNYSNTALLIYFSLLGFIMLYALILFFIGGAVTLGYCQFNLNLIERRNLRFTDIFSKFNMFWKAFLMQFLIGLFTFLWALLLIIPGIIAAYSYSMTPYILLENPDIPVLEAISRSKQMMVGNKWRLFCLHISFIGWILLCLITCGIGFFWLNPYMSAADAVFYNEVSGKNMRFGQGYNNYGYHGFNNNGYADNGNSNSGYNNTGYNNGWNNSGYGNSGNNNGWNNTVYNNSGNSNGWNNAGYNNTGNSYGPRNTSNINPNNNNLNNKPGYHSGNGNEMNNPDQNNPNV